jgi:hypothetical protein
MVVAALLVARPGRVATLGLVAVMAVILAGATGGRWLGLNLAEGDGRHYTAGTYTRISADGTAMTLTIDGAGYRFDDRWSGSLEGSGLVAVLVGDPACPDARGAYHVWAAGGEDIRWEMIVDTCADGARAADVVGTWARAR